MAKRVPGRDTEVRPTRRRWKAPRYPERLRVELEEGQSKSRGEAASGAARSLVSGHSAFSANKPLPAPPPHEEQSAYWWADDRSLNEASSLDVYGLDELVGRTGQNPPSQPAGQLEANFIPFPEPEAQRTSASMEPDAGSIHNVMAALDRDLTRRRCYRANRAKDEENCEADRADLDQASHEGPEVYPVSLHNRARQLRDRYKREQPSPIESESIDPLDFAIWLRTLKPFLGASSWRVYRKAGLAMIQVLPHENLDPAMTILSEDGRRRPIRAKKVDRRRLEKEGDISLTRADRITHSDYQKLLHRLPMISRGAAVSWLKDWLIAGISTGVGPAEWPLVELKEHQLGGDKRRLWLDVVDLAQRHDGRSLTYRTLDISGYRPDTVKAIERMVTNSRAWVTEGKIQQRRSECTQLLYEVCDRIFPSQGIKLSLFTFRHQFIANMKTLMHRAHVIAMAGSVDIDYKSEHYAKRRAAWKSSDIRDIPAPSEEQVERVLNYLKLVEDRKAVMRPTAMRRQEQDDEKF